jgi:hypothetical protein
VSDEYLDPGLPVIRMRWDRGTHLGCDAAGLVSEKFAFPYSLRAGEAGCMQIVFPSEEINV